MRSCVGGAWAIMSEPLSMKGRTRAWILFGGPILRPSAGPNNFKAHPYFEIERSSSTLRFRCSHFVTTMPAPGAAAPLPMLLFMPLMPFVWIMGPAEFHWPPPLPRLPWPGAPHLSSADMGPENGRLIGVLGPGVLRKPCCRPCCGNGLVTECAECAECAMGRLPRLVSRGGGGGMRICWCCTWLWWWRCPFIGAGATMDCVCRRCSWATLVESAATCCVSAARDASLASEEGAGGVRATDPELLEAPEALPDAAAADGAFAVEPGASAEPEGAFPPGAEGLVGAALSSTAASLLCRAAIVASAAANRLSSAVYSALDTVASEVFAPATTAGAADAAAAPALDVVAPDAPALSRP